VVPDLRESLGEYILYRQTAVKNLAVATSAGPAFHRYLPDRKTRPFDHHLLLQSPQGFRLG